VRAVFVVLSVAVLVGGCSGDNSNFASPAKSEAILNKDCADAKWKEQNLGLWYSVCRQPARW
jgi:hypothetical protein